MLLPIEPETPDSMREKLRDLRDDAPDTYRKMFRPLLPLDALPADALSDRQLEVICAAMLDGLARLALRDRRRSTLH
jgi:hypothetical protein